MAEIADWRLYCCENERLLRLGKLSAHILELGNIGLRCDCFPARFFDALDD
jgi:hypothetical protein